MVVIERDKSNIVFELEHVATFVEGRTEMAPAAIMEEVVNLDSNFVVPTACKLELSAEGIRVIREDKNETLEKAPWHRIYGESVLIPPESETDQRVLLVFRITLPESDVMGYENELIIFEIDSERDGRKILEHMLSYQKNIALRELSGTVSSPVPKNVSERMSRKRSSRRSPHSSPGPSNARTIYMLNRCLDDIEHFGRRLNKCVKRENSDSKDMLLRIDPVNVRLPGRHDAIETVRKIKMALNLAQQIQPDAPEAIEKIFIRLIKCIVWLDDICQSRIIPDYEMEMIQEVAEPLLYTSTINAIKQRLNPILMEFWTKLGDAWNVPEEQWPHPIVTYVPQFKTPYRRHLADLSSRSQGGGTGFGSLAQAVPKYSRPRINNKEYERFCQKVQDRGGRLCYATVRHVSSKSLELSAFQGEVFEIVDNTDEEWWTVANEAGESGQIPKWKLRPFYLSASMLDLRQKEPMIKESIVPRAHSRPHASKHPSVIRPRSDEEPWGLERTRSFRRHSIAKSRSMGSQLNMFAPYSYKDMEDTENPQPMMLYLPAEDIKRLREGSPAAPVILVPYEPRSNSKERDHSPERGFSQPRYRSVNRSPQRNGRDYSIERRRHFSSRVGSTYRPTIKLESAERGRYSRKYS